MSRQKPLSVKKKKVSKALKSLTDESLVVSPLDLEAGAEGYRWELYRGTLPFWVDLVRFSEGVDLLVTYSVMFGMPDGWDESREMELYRALLELNDFSQSWDTKFFLRERTVVLCASRSGEEIEEDSAAYLVRSFSRFAEKLCDLIADRFPDLVQFVVRKPEENSGPPDTVE